ncbi:MAG: NAD(P)H-hydrate dehydratase [Candidatus Omnitrophota bacterium]
MPTRLSRRNRNAHKGDFGHVFILAGSPRFSGAAFLCGLGALRSGAGLVTLGIPESLNDVFIKIKPREAMTLALPETKEKTLSLSGYKKIKVFAKTVDGLVLGPGLSRNKSTQSLARQVISEIAKPMVIDADGLNALVGYLRILRATHDTQRTPMILTPHPGEMARLLGIPIKKVQSQRTETARKFARDHKVTLVLKGHNSLVADDQGHFYINKTGNPGMATAGSGDVLAGMIGAFLGQGLRPFDAAKTAVYLHGLAGDLAAKEKTQISLIASDIIDKIPEAIKRSH